MAGAGIVAGVIGGLALARIVGAYIPDVRIPGVLPILGAATIGLTMGVICSGLSDCGEGAGLATLFPLWFRGSRSKTAARPGPVRCRLAATRRARQRRDEASGDGCGRAAP